MKEYMLTDEEYGEILAINRKGGDPVMYLPGGMPMGRSLGEKINDYWEELGRKRGFKDKTVQGVPGNKRAFRAEPTNTKGV